MNRFFVRKENVSDKYIKINDENVNHIKNVLRLKEGNEVEIICDGYKYISKITNLENEIILEILEKTKGENESPLEIYLYQGIAKGKKMDLIIQKATELGVKKVIPLITERTIVKLNKKENKKVERWNQIALEASKQSKRDEPLIVTDILDIKEISKYLLEEDYILVPYEKEDSLGIKTALKSYKKGKIHIVIGPEGGFTINEIEELQKEGALSVSLGPRILRTETAGMVAASVVLYEHGDLGVRL